MKEITIDNYTEIRDLIRDIQVNDQMNGRGTYFRGTKTNFLLPSLITGTKKSNDEYEIVEEKMNKEFGVKYGHLINQENPILYDWELRVE